jgi:uncharacterized membrane protein YphA (DoxX/SURF4 family)
VKPKAIAYWTATSFIALETLAGGAVDLLHGRTMVVAGPRVDEILENLGYPRYFLKILGVWKVLGGITLLAPRLPRLKEWAYAGVFFELTGAAASSMLHGDDRREMAVPLVFTGIAVASWALRPQTRTLGALFPN